MNKVMVLITSLENGLTRWTLIAVILVINKQYRKYALMIFFINFKFLHWVFKIVFICTLSIRCFFGMAIRILLGIMCIIIINYIEKKIKKIKEFQLIL